MRQPFEFACKSGRCYLVVLSHWLDIFAVTLPIPESPPTVCVSLIVLICLCCWYHRPLITPQSGGSSLFGGMLAKQDTKPDGQAGILESIPPGLCSGNSEVAQRKPCVSWGIQLQCF